VHVRIHFSDLGLWHCIAKGFIPPLFSPDLARRLTAEQELTSGPRGSRASQPQPNMASMACARTLTPVCAGVMQSTLCGPCHSLRIIKAVVAHEARYKCQETTTAPVITISGRSHATSQAGWAGGDRDNKDNKDHLAGDSIPATQGIARHAPAR